MKSVRAREVDDPPPIERIAALIEVALFDPEPVIRLEARAYLRNVDFELLLIAARQGS